MKEMKDSGIEWIGEIPRHWDIVRMKSCISQRDSGAWGEEAQGEIGDEICLRIADFNYTTFRFKNTPIEDLTKRHYTKETIEYLKLQKNDILIEKSGGGEKTPVGRTVIFDKEYIALYANFMDRLRCAYFVLPMFMQYVFVTFYKNDYTRNYIKQTTGIQNLDLTSMLSQESVPLPPIEEQQAIADFLDKQCAEIDSVIEQTKATIEEYKKLKQSVITEAVTKGIRGDRPMKDSGIEWIGEIPQDFVVIKLKYLLNVYSGEGIKNEELTDLGKYPVYGGGEVIGYNNDYNVENSLLIGRVGARCGCITLVEEKAWATDNALVVKSFVNSKYLFYLLTSANLNNLNTSNAQPLITGSKIKGQYTVFVQDEKTQKLIVSYLDQKCAEIDTLIEKKTALLEEMEALKKSIIFEYVTGKKEVV